MEKRRRKKNRIRVVLICAGIVIVAAVCFLAAFIVAGKVKQNRYETSLASAKQYLLSDNFEAAEQVYRDTIELFPEKTEAYQDLIGLYLEQEDYDSAYMTAQEGYDNTRDSFFETMIQRLLERRKKENQAEIKPEIPQEIILDEDNDNLAVRFMFLENVAKFCYQQYVNTYGSCDVTVAQDKGYQAKFANLRGSVYFKNTSEQPEAVDTASRKVAKRAKPYEIVLFSPSMLFVGYDGSISCAKLNAIFGLTATPQEDENGVWWMTFTSHGCTVSLETDSQGNLSGKSPSIIVRPLDLTTVEWEEDEEEDEEEVDENTFVLAGETYTYDVETLYITDAVLSDLSPLSKCKKLRKIYFIGCKITDLSPVSGCSALQEMNLEGSYGNMDLSCLKGLTSLLYLGFHECSDIDDISPIMDLDLKLLHPCGSSVPYEQIQDYMNKHPGCEVWYDYYCVSG